MNKKKLILLWEYIFYYKKMRNLEIVNGKIQLYEDEQKMMEKYVKKRNGKILWGMMYEEIKEGKKVIEYLPWVTRKGFMVTSLKDIE